MNYLAALIWAKFSWLKIDRLANNSPRVVTGVVRQRRRDWSFRLKPTLELVVSEDILAIVGETVVVEVFVSEAINETIARKAMAVETKVAEAIRWVLWPAESLIRTVASKLVKQTKWETEISEISKMWKKLKARAPLLFVKRKSEIRARIIFSNPSECNSLRPCSHRKHYRYQLLIFSFR